MKIYVAGPYSSAPEGNTQRAILYGLKLMAEGHSPYIPHLTHFMDLVANELGELVPYERWLELDNDWLPLCDELHRLSGASSGADEEVALAETLGILVVYVSVTDEMG